jgi:hypothetical protein
MMSELRFGMDYLSHVSEEDFQEVLYYWEWGSPWVDSVARYEGYLAVVTRLITFPGATVIQCFR